MSDFYKGLVVTGAGMLIGLGSAFLLDVNMRSLVGFIGVCAGIVVFAGGITTIIVGNPWGDK